MINITSALTWAPCVRRRTKERSAGVNPTSSASASPNRKHFPAPVARCRPPLRGCKQLKTACLMSHRRKDKLINLEAALVNDVPCVCVHRVKVMDDKLRSPGNNMQQLHFALKGCQRHCRSNCYCNRARIFTEWWSDSIKFKLRLKWMKGWNKSYLHTSAWPWQQEDRVRSSLIVPQSVSNCT